MMILPEGITDIKMVTVHVPGGTLPNGTPNGLGGVTKYGPAWVLHGRLTSEPVALFESQADAVELYSLIEEGELWARKQKRLQAIAAVEAAEAEGLAISKANAKTVARANEGGDGLSRRLRSSGRPSASSGRGTSRREKLRRASETTS